MVTCAPPPELSTVTLKLCMLGVCLGIAPWQAQCHQEMETRTEFHQLIEVHVTGQSPQSCPQKKQRLRENGKRDYSGNKSETIVDVKAGLNSWLTSFVRMLTEQCHIIILFRFDHLLQLSSCFCSHGVQFEQVAGGGNNYCCEIALSESSFVSL